ncbi:MAG: hypothetical protein ACKOSQ_10595 [Planctomycetaceae bacterium]
MRVARQSAGTVVAVALAGAALAVSAADRVSGFRPLAPGVLTVIPAPAAPPGVAASATDTVSRDDLLDITVGRAGMAWKPLQSPPHTTFVERGRDREYARDVWNLEFAFKAPRMIDVDVPTAGMKMQRKRIWYLVYRVRNAGGRRPKIDADDAARRTTVAFETPIRFVPHFVLESLEPLDEGEGLAAYRAYLDRVIPAALGPIRKREAGGGEILDSAAMVAKAIGPGEERWGVATWEDIDPRVDHFSIYVRGLTNALEWRRRPGAAIRAADPPGIAMEEALRTLRLDFWRPGDDRDEVEEEMSVGFAGMFERMTLGSRLLEAVGTEGRDAARPGDGLAALGLTWSDLLEPAEAAAPAAADAGISLLPLQAVIGRLAALPEPRNRADAIRVLFGDVGGLAFDELLRSLVGPPAAGGDPERIAALAALGLTPEAVAKQPLASLATLVRALEAERTPAARRGLATRLLGPAGRRVEWLGRRVALARTLAALAALDLRPGDVAAGDALRAFDLVRVPIEAEADPAKRATILRGLFGAGGPRLFAAAAAVNEGIDHSWVFRYEEAVPGS